MSRVIVTMGKNITERTLTSLKTLSPKLPEENSKILIKPNLVEPMPKDSGAITRPEIIEGVIQYLQSLGKYEIYVGEGAAIYETEKCFEEAKYYDILSKYDVKFVNLNEGPFVKLKIEDGKIWKEVEVAKLATESYIISTPVLKEHAFQVTLSLKNMMGILKPRGGYPNKSYIHPDTDKNFAERLCDLLTVVKPNLTVIDATTGMFGSHLYGRIKEFDLTIASEDALAADIVCAKILGHEKVFYLDLALKRKIGKLPTEIKEVKV